jgi:hypothetical protein
MHIRLSFDWLKCTSSERLEDLVTPHDICPRTGDTSAQPHKAPRALFAEANGAMLSLRIGVIRRSVRLPTWRPPQRVGRLDVETAARLWRL